ncbi:hypothetical protein ACFXOY_28285 [Streptomyces niveus]|uniref:hypothetical protein n=1 Tax=Streptomyces niveus TaxID=193462 RepID=UPI0036775E36
MPSPELTPLAGARVEGDWIVWDVQFPARKPSGPLPEDFYLRELMDLDLDDMASVADWMSRWGHFGDSFFEAATWDEEDMRLLQDVLAIEHPDRAGGEVHHDVVRLHARQAQKAISTWLACRQEGGLEQLVADGVTADHLAALRAENPHLGGAWPRDLKELSDVLISLRLQHLERTLNAALHVFSVGIGTLSDRQPTIYAAAFLQLYNHLAEDATIRECANETCRRVYVRQRGRAEYGQNRTSGTKYCTRECARAQAQRQHRRRKAAARRSLHATPEPEHRDLTRDGDQTKE